MRDWGDALVRRRVGVVLVVGVGITLIALALANVVVLRQAHDLRARAARVTAEQRATDATTDTLRERWDRLDSAVAEAKVQLATADATQNGAGDELAATTADYQAARSELDQLQAALAATQHAAAQAGSEASQRAALTQALADCLTGVSQILNALSVGDNTRAVAAARGIREPCSLVGVAVKS